MDSLLPKQPGTVPNHPINFNIHRRPIIFLIHNFYKFSLQKLSPTKQPHKLMPDKRNVCASNKNILKKIAN